VDAFELVERAAATEVPVLLDGESGTGKELMARTLHRLSARARAAFVAVNVATLTPELVASELFGHAAGAFTGARGDRRGLVAEADGGTLFLDEIGDMPLPVQPALLRFLEDATLRPVGSNKTQRVDVRLVCATNRDLPADVASGRFREDLYHRLAGVVVRLPPLRERPGDLAMLASHFLREASAGRHRELPMAWWPAFRAHGWPGNVRELRNAIRAVAQLSRGGELEPRFLPSPLRERVTAAASGEAGRAGGRDVSARRTSDFDGWTLEEVEREMVRQALEACAGHRGRAAQRLGISPRSLYDRCRRYGVG
jgi:DNA-binding NtrC family response regulator